MANTSKALKILAVGAGGPAASLVIPELLKRGVDVRAFAHKAEDEPMIQKLGVTDIVVGELADSAAVVRAVAGLEAVFYIAPAALDNEAAVGKQFVEAAKQAGVRRVVFSSVIHPVLSELDNHAAKAPVEEALLDSGMEYVFLHPALFFQNFAPSWNEVKQTGEYGEPWSAETRFSRVDYRDVAEVAAMALTEDRLLYGTFELCAEGHLNRHDTAALMSEVLGKPVKVASVDPSKQAGGPSKLARMVEWYDKHPLLGNSLTLEAILGREPRSLRTYPGTQRAGLIRTPNHIQNNKEPCMVGTTAPNSITRTIHPREHRACIDWPSGRGVTTDRLVQLRPIVAERGPASPRRRRNSKSRSSSRGARKIAFKADLADTGQRSAKCVQAPRKREGIVNAWADPKFSGAVEATGRKNLTIMGGVTTDICLEFQISARRNSATACRPCSTHPGPHGTCRERWRSGVCSRRRRADYDQHGQWLSWWRTGRRRPEPHAPIRSP